MLQFLLDTDHVTLLQHGHPRIGQRLVALANDAVGIGIVTAEEALRGRVAALARSLDGPTRIARYALLERTIRILHDLPIVSFDQASEIQFQNLLGLRLRVGSGDLKIAAIALAHQLILVTRNRRDFARIPGILLDDWRI